MPLHCSEESACQMFRAIDIDGDNGLSYGEVVSVLEPPTLTSVSMNDGHEKQQLEALAGFLNFTVGQAEVARNDPDGKLLAAALRHDAERKAMEAAHGRGHTIEPGLADGVKMGVDIGTGAVVRDPVHLNRHQKAVDFVERRAAAVDPTPWALEVANRRKTWPSRYHKLEDIRQRAEEQVQSKTIQGGARFLALFRQADAYVYGGCVSVSVRMGAHAAAPCAHCPPAGTGPGTWTRVSSRSCWASAG